MLFLINLMMCVMTMTLVGPIESIDTNDTIPYNVNETLKSTRRILHGRQVGDTRPYMVYLRSAPNTDPKFTDSDWICGGVIIHDRYILTSAACIEDVKHFYVVSGTHKWVPLSDKSNECIKNGAKKAVWKCVPKSYIYDGGEFNNIRWMIGDIAVVKVEENFNFEKRVRGCDFIPKKVDYNNRSADLEKHRSYGSIAGWGSSDTFEDVDQDPTMLRTSTNSPELMETDVQLIAGKNCKKRWEPRYHFLIDEHMVCTKDITDEEAMSSLCSNHEVNCKELQYSDDDYDYDNENPNAPNPPETRRMVAEPGQLQIHTGVNFHDTRRKNKVPTGGFCENDHGGPLIVGQGKTAVVVGVMSACLTRETSRKCYGPFLFTSVYRYRNLITCAINKELGATCRKLLRTSKTSIAETNFDWSNHKDEQKRSFGVVNKEIEDKNEQTIAPEKNVHTMLDELLGVDQRNDRLEKLIPRTSPAPKLPEKDPTK